MKKFLFSLVVIALLGVYAFVQYVGDNDCYYRINGNRIQVASGICLKNTLHELPMDGRFGFSAKIKRNDTDSESFSAVLMGEYVLASNKQQLGYLLDTLDVSLCTPRQAIEQKLQKEIAAALSNLPIGCFAAEDITASVEKELNSLIMYKGFQIHTDYASFEFPPYIQEVITAAQKSFEKVRQARADLEKAQAQADSLLNVQKLTQPRSADYAEENSSNL